MTEFSRRSFLQQATLVTGYLLLGVNKVSGEVVKVSPEALKATELNNFIKVTNNNDIIIVVSRSEMGQGIRTSLASVVADELEADISKVTIEQAEGNAKYGDQNTDGSKSVRAFFMPLRQAGATVKAMMISAAAKKWNISESECYAKNGQVHNKRGSKTFSYGELAELASTLPVPKTVELKDKKDFKYIGKELKNADINEIVTGKAVFGIDAVVPGMLYAAVKRCPVVGGEAVSFNANKAMAVRGVKKVIEIKKTDSSFSPFSGIAVIANNTWTAFKARDLIEVKWDYGKNANYDSKKFLKQMSDSVHKKGEVIKTEGDAYRAVDSSEIVHESSFNIPHLSHATMEPPNAVASVTSKGCEVWAPTQDPQTVQKEIAKFLGLKNEQVIVNVTFLGGGFGRKSKPDFILEAVALSKEMNAPVKVVWSREDDIAHDFYHTVSSQYLKAGMDKNGNVTSWIHRSAFPTIASTFDKRANKPATFELNQGMLNLPFAIDNISCETTETDSHVRIGWLRSVCNIFHSFSVNVFVDELARKAKKDPVEFRMNMIGANRKIKFDKVDITLDTARYKNVLKKVAKNSGWGRKLPKGKGMGIAIHYSFFSYVAEVVEVTVKGDNITVDKVYCVIDCGTAVNKDAVKAQMEGGIIFGLSLAKYGKITAKDGMIEQSNFDTYPLIRMSEAPEIHVEIIDTGDIPTGVGEPGVPPLAPALVNAIFDATGKRYYNLPLVSV